MAGETEVETPVTPVESPVIVEEPPAPILAVVVPERWAPVKMFGSNFEFFSPKNEIETQTETPSEVKFSPKSSPIFDDKPQEKILVSMHTQTEWV